MENSRFLFRAHQQRFFEKMPTKVCRSVRSIFPTALFLKLFQCKVFINAPHELDSAIAVGESPASQQLFKVTTEWIYTDS